jgi:hypothetical protein
VNIVYAFTAAATRSTTNKSVAMGFVANSRNERQVRIIKGLFSARDKDINDALRRQIKPTQRAAVKFYDLPPRTDA